MDQHSTTDQRRQLPDLSGTVALVAGASRGIGAATAQAFAAAGAAVVLGARDQQRLDAVADRIRQTGGQATTRRTDVTDPAAGRALVETATDTYGRLDFAFNTATSDRNRPGRLADLEVEMFDAEIATNVRGTFLGMKYQIPAMIASGGGSIINMASTAGVGAVSNLGAYATAKAGIIRLSQVAALDYADQTVRINVVAPGPIRTHHIEAAGERAQQLAAAAVPMRRMGLPEEVADVVLWLSSRASAYVTGAVIPIDGGQSAGSKPPQMMDL